MQLVETDGELNLDAPTDGWLHLIERDGKSGDLLGTGHAARLADRQGRFHAEMRRCGWSGARSPHR
jgi:hypothetical protein